MRTKVTVTVAAAVVLLAGCTAAPEPAPSSAQPSATASATSPSANPSTGVTPTTQPSASPSLPATHVEVESVGGTLTGTVPADWDACEGADARASASALDVLGAWGVGAPCGEGALVTIASFESPDASLTAERYYDEVFAPGALDAGLEIDHQIFRTGGGYEVLMVEARAGAGSADSDDATFTVFAGSVVIVGKLADAGDLDAAVVGQLAAIAESIRVS